MGEWERVEDWRKEITWFLNQEPLAAMELAEMKTTSGRMAMMLGVAGVMGLAGSAFAQLRVCNWNVTNYASGRVSEFQTAFYGVPPAGTLLAGRAMAPDVIIGQEFLSASAVTNFLSLLNTAPGSPGDWSAATFNDGPDSDGAFFYRRAKMQPISGTVVGTVIVSIGQVNTDGIPPRNSQRYDLQLVGYPAVEAARISFYNSHAKAGDTSADQAKRFTEFQRISTNALTLPSGRAFVFGADTNTQTSSQAAYQQLVNQVVGGGPFWDPINRPGSWENSGTFRFIHTQDPSATGQMDSRHDQILISALLRDGRGFDYIGDTTTTNAFSATSVDTRHSYLCWGNDGSGNGTTSGLRIAGNTQVGQAIAQALQSSALTGGHLPVTADFRVPARITVTPSSLNLGTVIAGSSVPGTAVTVVHAGDVARWGASGIANLNYTMASPTALPAGFTITNAVGNQVLTPGASRVHTLNFTASTPGTYSGVLAIDHDAAELVANPLIGDLVIPVTVTVVANCGLADMGSEGGLDQPDGVLDNNDFIVFIDRFFSGQPGADLGSEGGAAGSDGIFDNNDFIVFIGLFFQGC
jgi:hypothetical protein